MNLSENFTLEEATFSETAIRKGIKNVPDATQLENMRKAAVGMEQVRSILGTPVLVSSWLRVLRLNRAIGSKDTSDHVEGWAIDFRSPKFGTPRLICERLKACSDLRFDQLILEGVSKQDPNGRWVHISFDPKMRGQVLTMHIDSKGKQTYTVGLN